MWIFSFLLWFMFFFFFLPGQTGSLVWLRWSADNICVHFVTLCTPFSCNSIIAGNTFALLLPPGTSQRGASSLALLAAFWIFYKTIKYTELPTEENNYKGPKKLKAANLAVCFCIIRTSISPSNAAASSRVTLKGVVFRRLEPFWGDFRFLFGDIFSDTSSASLCSSKCLEFCSLKKRSKKKNYTFPWS